MPFVFVHGVNNRLDDSYNRDVELRAAFLRRLVAPAVGIDPTHQIYSPYWGGNGVRFWRNLEVVPRGNEDERLGADVNVLSPALGIALESGQLRDGDQIKNLAEREPELLVDLLFDAVILEAQSEEDIQAVAQAYCLAQDRLAEQHNQWLSQISDGDALLNKVFDLVEPRTPKASIEALGGQRFWDMLSEGFRRSALLGLAQISRAVVQPSRLPLTRALATFVGDAFRYLDERGDGSKLGPIASVVIDAFNQAASVAKNKQEPLIVISHSFGGEIVYDILTHYAENMELEIDVWVTVGSQVGLFEEMSLLLSSPGRTDVSATPREAIPSPTRVKHWLNIFDTNDVLGFKVLPVFTASVPGTVKDYEYETGFTVFGAHSGYFNWPSFYRRLEKRIVEGMIGNDASKTS
ncbi:hypothetical protein O5O45_12095 [Hahella aquimaris]|uniref:hypothetical protein n=1 Tax=Hahella sp. HNIBRBA332 TaxID=3015983 RepID=UPI00273AE597|nr:hypothetical protein [Hahella sp. HNIBRBA332]WLQ16661.1 hypothetical protein O5O45_12095 [Hahella sp. HNIBRBA332]